MSNMFVCLVIAISSFLAASNLHAEAKNGNVDLVTSISVGNKAIDFEEDRTGAAFFTNGTRFEDDFLLEQDFSESLEFVGLSLTASYQELYLSVAVEIPLSDAEYRQSITTTQSGEAEELVGIRTGDIERLDYAFTVGYNVWKNLSVFVGYKYGETQLDPDVGEESFSPRDFEQSYEEDGFFLGAGYGIPIGDVGLLSFSIAYAFLDAEYSESGSFGIVPAGNTNTTIPGRTQYEGDADGLSFGVKWSGPLTDSLQYSLSYKFHEYELDGSGTRPELLNPNSPDNAGFPPGTPSDLVKILQDVQTTETMSMIAIGLDYLF